MTVGPNYVYLAIPRTASVAISAWLCENYQGQTIEPYHSMEIPQEHQGKFTFATVRDPYARALSLWNMMRHKFWNGRAVDIAESSFPEFLDRCSRHPNQKWFAQSRMVEIAKRHCPQLCVFPFETLPWCLSDLPFLNLHLPAPPHLNAVPNDKWYTLQQRGAIEAVNRYEGIGVEGSLGYPRKLENIMSYTYPIQEDTSWGSWTAPLVSCLAATDGPVLEVGMGDWSTPWLHQYCACTGRKLVSVESAGSWAEKFFGLRLCQHEVVVEDYGGYLAKKAVEQWSVVFLDHSPGVRRAEDALLFRSSAEFIVVHDWSSAEIRGQFTQEVLNRWEYRYAVSYSPSSLVLGHRPLKIPKGERI